MDNMKVLKVIEKKIPTHWKQILYKNIKKYQKN